MMASSWRLLFWLDTPLSICLLVRSIIIEAFSTMIVERYGGLRKSFSLVERVTMLLECLKYA